MRTLLACFACVILAGSAAALTPAEQGKVVARARLEVQRAVAYDASYRRLAYPRDDIDSRRGACADLVVRALRAIGCDLQVKVYQDRRQHPTRYGRGRPDPNIDHRRCCNQMIWMRAHARALTRDPARVKEWLPGDLVYWDLTGAGLLHTGVVSDRKNDDGRPLVIHNLGPVATEEDVLTNWKVVEHFRLEIAPIRAQQH